MTRMQDAAELMAQEESLAQAETDALLAKVVEARSRHQFNPLDADGQATLRQLVAHFTDKRGMKRLRIAETLGDIGKPATAAALEGLAQHPDPVVRRACAKTITLIKDPAAIPGLVEALLHDEDTVVHGSAAGALAQIGKPAVPIMLELLGKPETPETTKGHLAWALSFMGEEAKDDLLGAAVASEAAAVRAAAVSAIAKLAQEAFEQGNAVDQPSLQVLTQALSDGSEEVRSEAIAVLADLAYEPAVPELIALLQHESPSSRKAAALAMMKIGDPRAIAPLKAQLEQESDFALENAIQMAIAQLER